jgi:hypothetical protein
MPHVVYWLLTAPQKVTVMKSDEIFKLILGRKILNVCQPN